MPRSGSAEYGAHASFLPTPFVPGFDPFFHVSAPNSPGCGTRLNFQSCFPVRMSKPRIVPGTLCARMG